MMDTRTPDRTGRITSVVVAIVPSIPSFLQQGGDDDSNRYGVDDGSLAGFLGEWTVG